MLVVWFFSGVRTHSLTPVGPGDCRKLDPFSVSVVIVIVIVIVILFFVVTSCCNSSRDCGELLGVATLRLQSCLPPGFGGASYDLSGWCFVEAWCMARRHERMCSRKRQDSHVRSERNKVTAVGKCSQ